MRVFSVVSTKGGVGKTTVTANLGALLADLGLNVLMINADATQESLSKYYALSHRAPKGLTALVTTRTVTPDMISRVCLPAPEAAEARIRRRRPPRGKLDLIYSDAGPELATWCAERYDYFWHLQEAMRNPVVHDQYDICLIDTQGAEGPIQTAAVVAADRIIHPVTPDYLAASEFAGPFLNLLDRVAPIMRGPMPEVLAVICRQANASDTRGMAAEIRQEYVRLRGGVVVASTVIPDLKVFRDSARQHAPAHWLDTKRAADVMHQLAWELLPQLDGLRITDLADEDELEEPTTEDLEPGEETV